MKRFYVTAAIAASLLATGCQKTYVIDEVRTPIGFSTEVGKQTKAIVDNSETNPGAYPDGQPFGVFAYGVTGTDTDGAWSSSFVIDNKNTVMNNVKITKQTDEWKAESGKYYWPNDSHTTLSFFAYSPYSKAKTSESANDAVGMGVTPTFSVAEGIKLTAYTHDKYKGDDAVDFMVAENKNQKYESNTTNNGTVKLQFKHQLTQLVFAVKKAAEYDGITMTLQSIKLNNIVNKADFKNEAWTLLSSTDTYTIEFASDVNMVLSTTAVSSNGITVIPQSLTASAESAPGQTMTIVYKISGTGVAEETVTKTVDLRTDSLTLWDKNQKITYNISIGMKEILFSPTVDNWTDGGTGDINIIQ